MLGWAFLLLLLGVILNLPWNSGQLAPYEPAPRGWLLWARCGVALAPSLCIITFIAVPTIRAIYRRQTPWLTLAKDSRGRPVRLLIILLIVVAAGLLFAFAGLQPLLLLTRERPFSPRFYEYVLGVVPLMLMLSVFVAVSAIARGAGLRMHWEAQPFMHRPYVLETTDDGIALREALSQHGYRWEYFPGFRETPTLMLLFVSPYGFWIIPSAPSPSRFSCSSSRACSSCT